MNRWSALAVLLAFAGALTFRLSRLETRPFHNDEAVNALKVTELWQQGRYAYDPDEYHGPTLHYATLPFLWLSPAHNADELSDGILRFAPVAFGAGLILLLFLFVDGLGAHAVAWSALFVAISPAMVFYSRYFIHEMLLVFFSALALGAAWRYTRKPSLAWALTTGAAIGLMFATKETFVISLAAAFLALILQTRTDIPLRNFFRQPTARLQFAAALFATFIIWLLFFSSFFTNWNGLLDSFRTYFPWLKRAAGHSPHLHPWYFYFQRLGWFHPAKGPIWSEGLILLLALIGAAVSFRQKNRPLPRFLALYTLILTASYSLISYKTPWCLLSFYFGMILLAGLGAAFLFEQIRSRAAQTITVGFLLACSAQLAFQSWRASFAYATDRRNPYVYAQTVPDLLNLVQRLQGLARVSPDHFDMVVKIIAPRGDYWPLPWYLRRFKQTGWYEQLPEDPFAPIMIIASALDARLDEKSDHKWIMTGVSEFRPGKFFELYVEKELWTQYVGTLPPSPD